MSKRWFPLISLVSFSGSLVWNCVGAIAAPIPLTEATLRKVMNEVELRLHQQAPRPAQVNDRLGSGDGLKTQRSSRAELKFNDGTLAKVGELAVFSFTPNTRRFDLQNGTYLFLVPPGRGSTEFYTPNARAGVRGSALFLRYNAETNTTTMGALTNNPLGPMDITVGGVRQDLYAGQMAVVVKDRIERVETFDLRTFFNTSPLFKDVDFSDPDIQAVRQEIGDALQVQVALQTGAPTAQTPASLKAVSSSPGSVQAVTAPIARPSLPTQTDPALAQLREPALVKPSIPTVNPGNPIENPVTPVGKPIKDDGPLAVKPTPTPVIITPPPIKVDPKPIKDLPPIKIDPKPIKDRPDPHDHDRPKPDNNDRPKPDDHDRPKPEIKELPKSVEPRLEMPKIAPTKELPKPEAPRSIEPKSVAPTLDMPKVEPKALPQTVPPPPIAAPVVTSPPTPPTVPQPIIQHDTPIAKPVMVERIVVPTTPIPTVAPPTSAVPPVRQVPPTTSVEPTVVPAATPVAPIVVTPTVTPPTVTPPTVTPPTVTPTTPIVPVVPPVTQNTPPPIVPAVVPVVVPAATPVVPVVPAPVVAPMPDPVAKTLPPVEVVPTPSVTPTTPPPTTTPPTTTPPTTTP